MYRKQSREFQYHSLQRGDDETAKSLRQK